MSNERLHFAVLALLLALGVRASALGIALDYSYDPGLRADARAVLDKVAQDLGNLLSTSPGAVTADMFSGTSGGATVTFDWSLSFTNPATGQGITQPTFTADAGAIVMHVGFRPLSGNTLESSDFIHATETVTAPNISGTVTAAGIAAGASNAMMPRSDGPVIGSYSASFSGTSYQLRYGDFGGSISFQNDVDGNGSGDPGNLDSYWSFSLAGPVAGKYDFYSAALRGMVTALGFGHSQAWLAQASGTNWLGPQASAFFGSGQNIITTDGMIAPGLEGASLVDGSSQVALMAPGLALGERRYLTTLDTAFLADMDYRFVPEPGTSFLLAMGAALLALGRRNPTPPVPLRAHPRISRSERQARP